MIKRISCIIAVIIIMAVSLIPIVSAEDEYIVVPSTDRQPLYEILPSAELAGVEPYTVYGYSESSITVLDNPQPFIRHFFDTIAPGEYYLNMYSTESTTRRSRLRLWVSNNSTLRLYYEVGDFANNSIDEYYQYPITPVIPQSADIAIIAMRTGALNVYYYDTDTNQPLYDLTGGYNQELSYYFIGDIYVYGRTPSDIDNSLLKDAFNRGKEEGLNEGISIGYTEGLKDGALTSYDETQIYNAGKEAGYSEGYNEGFEDGALFDNEEVYNKGIEKGQQDAQIIPQAINGFFGAMRGFFEPFLSIGFGSLNLLNLLGIIIVVGIVIIIVKITRG